MPFFNFKCCKCLKKHTLFLEQSDLKELQACDCGYTLTRVLNSKIDKKNENPPYQTAEDCVEDSKNEVLKLLESFKGEFGKWK